ncbi:NAD(P)-dependent oxidoreductase [Patescibacteria group bacterium]|nr:NAD(P)-dependent oxidoreductase [Patescibacteria group bacterium]MCL5091655.1 NAD(P)-dependent oxidoreductase [Patescibacteria group bacterium]
MLTVAVTGASGLIGSRLVEQLSDRVRFLPIQQEQCDITDQDAVWRALKDVRFDLLLHLAAYTNVDQAETARALVWKVNVDGTKHLLAAARQKNKGFIYVSTGFVFDGKKEHVPFTENSTPHPICYYGQSKYAGEQVVAGQAMIVRLDYPYGHSPAAKPDFVTAIRKRLQANQTVTMVNDSMITPTLIDDLIGRLGFLMQHYTPEIFHLVGSDSLSPLQAGRAIAAAFHLDRTLIQPTSYREFFRGRAKRPQFSVIRSTKNPGYPMHAFADGLRLL